MVSISGNIEKTSFLLFVVGLDVLIFIILMGRYVKHVI